MGGEGEAAEAEAEEMDCRLQKIRPFFFPDSKVYSYSLVIDYVLQHRFFPFLHFLTSPSSAPRYALVSTSLIDDMRLSVSLC